MTCCSRLGVEIMKPLVLVACGLKNTVGCLLRVAREPQSGLSRKTQLPRQQRRQDFRFSFRSVVGYVGMLCGVEVQVGVCRLGCASWGVPSAFMMTRVSCFLLLLTACLFVRYLLSVMGCSSMSNWHVSQFSWQCAQLLAVGLALACLAFTFRLLG